MDSDPCSKCNGKGEVGLHGLFGEYVPCDRCTVESIKINVEILEERIRELDDVKLTDSIMKASTKLLKDTGEYKS